MSLFARRLANASAVAVAALVGCGGRTPLFLFDDGNGAPGAPDAAGPLGQPDAGLADVVAIPDAATPDAADESIVVSGDDAGGSCCGDEQNTDYPPSINCSGTTIAWQYIPSCDFEVVRIELHKSGGTVALLDSEGSQPGATLWSANLPSSPTGDAEWEGADVAPPVALHAGHVYFLEESSGTCSIATDGTEYPYYGLSGDGSWDGPYTWHPWTSHVYGACH
jgi:hypothetical protein